MLLGLLNIAAGIPKVLQMPQELAFLEAIGLNAIVTSLLGLVQFAGGCFLLWTDTRFIGALLSDFALLVSMVALYASGNPLF